MFVYGGRCEANVCGEMDLKGFQGWETRETRRVESKVDSGGPVHGGISSALLCNRSLSGANDVLGHEWLRAQKKQWEEDQIPAYKKPFVIGGTCVIFMILAAGGLRWRRQRSRKDVRERTVEQEEKDEEEEI